MIRPARLAFWIGVALLAPAPAAAVAGTANLTAGSLTFAANAGEANVISVAQSGAIYTITDTGATVAPSGGCAAVNPNQVACTNPDVSEISIDLGDLGDSATIADSVTILADNRVQVQGGAGGDTITTGSGAPSIVNGDDDADVLTGGGKDDFFDGGGGGDQITGAAGEDFIASSEGDDVAAGGPGDDNFTGGNAADGADTFDGGPGADDLSLDSRNENLGIDMDGVADDGAGCPGPGCEADNVLPSLERLRAGDGDDVLVGSAAINFLGGRGGNDVISGAAGPDTLQGDVGNDALSGDAGNDNIHASDGADTMAGGGGDDTLDDDSFDRKTDIYSGGRGLDLADFGGNQLPVRVDLDGQPDDGVSSPLVGGPLNNVRADVEDVAGGVGDDVLIGNGAANDLTGAGGNDRLVGKKGPDGLIGGAGNDLLLGGAARDFFDGGGGTDRLTSRDGKPDEVQCGSAVDRVKADRRDATAPDCEKVRRR